MRRLESSGNNAIAYADDIAIAAGVCPQTLSDKLNLALSIVLDWCGVFELSKTDTILFTRRYKVMPSASLV